MPRLPESPCPNCALAPRPLRCRVTNPHTERMLWQTHPVLAMLSWVTILTHSSCSQLCRTLASPLRNETGSYLSPLQTQVSCRTLISPLRAIQGKASHGKELATGIEGVPKRQVAIGISRHFRDLLQLYGPDESNNTLRQGNIKRENAMCLPNRVPSFVPCRLQACAIYLPICAQYSIVVFDRAIGCRPSSKISPSLGCSLDVPYKTKQEAE